MSEEDALTFDHILIRDEGPDWGRYVYEDVSERPIAEKRWFDVLESQTAYAVHWWQQLNLNKPTLVGDLQRLSNETGTRAVVDDEAPIVTFKSTYPDVFECLEATFRLYPPIVDWPR